MSKENAHLNTIIAHFDEYHIMVDPEIRGSELDGNEIRLAYPTPSEEIDVYFHWFKKNPVVSQVSPMTFTLLHEIGHGQMLQYHFPKNPIFDFFLDILIYFPFGIFRKLANHIYMNSRNEKIASGWAIRYIEAFLK